MAPNQKNKRKTHVRKQNFMFNNKKKLFHTHLFSRESKRMSHQPENKVRVEARLLILSL
jgi:hypothetical protein